MRAPPILLAILCWLAPACGEDDAPVRPPPGQATPAPAVSGAPAGRPGGRPGKQLVPQISIEDRVICRVESNPRKRCDPLNPRCEKQTDHCITNSEGSFCGPCKERDAIRHVFRPRDFVPTFETRDPFQSFIVAQPGLGPGDGAGAGVPLDPAKNCTREDQMVAQSSSYLDLKLRVIVTRGTQRKVLMEDSTGLGHIIKRGDCVGREKAVVREIGKEFITFELHEPAIGDAPKREPAQRSVQLYPKQLPVSALPGEPPPRPATAPVVAPPAPGAGSAAPPPAPGTRIQVVPPPPTVPVVPPPAPTTLTP